MKSSTSSTASGPVSLAPLSRYCTAYRLGLIASVLATGTGKGALRTANACGAPTAHWSLEERRWCSFLRWCLNQRVSNRFDAHISQPFSSTGISVVVDNILSYLPVDQKGVFGIKYRSVKRARPDEEEEKNAFREQITGNATATTPMKSGAATRVNPKISQSDASASGDDTLTPCFFVEPPFTDAVSIFVRIYSTTVLSDEELNHLFGRYGMMHARRVGLRKSKTEHVSAGAGGRVDELCGDDGANGITNAVVNHGDNNNTSTNSNTNTQQQGGGSSASADISDASDDYLQSFIVTLDDNRNCLRAIQEVRQPEVVFIAFSKPERNVYCVADLPCERSHLQTLLQTVIQYPPRTKLYAHVVASLRLARGGSLVGGGGVGESGSRGKSHGGGGGLSQGASADTSTYTSFIPDLVVDHLPYWTTREQLKERFSAHGTIRKLKLSVDDRNGSFLGTALVGMGSLQESVAASEALHGVAIEEGWPMTVGVLNEQLDIVSLKTGELLWACEDPTSSSHMAQNAVEQRRVWV